jgi:hypothetical protein
VVDTVAGEEEALALGVAMAVDVSHVTEIFQLVFLFVIFVMIVGQKIFEGRLDNLVLLKTSTCPEITIVETQGDLALSNF